MYTLGYYRPGSCAPYMLDPLPISVRAGLMEAGVVDRRRVPPAVTVEAQSDIHEGRDALSRSSFIFCLALIDHEEQEGHEEARGERDSREQASCASCPSWCENKGLLSIADIERDSPPVPRIRRVRKLPPGKPKTQFNGSGGVHALDRGVARHKYGCFGLRR